LFTFDEQQKSNFECKQGIKDGGRLTAGVA
jgi:hypothetical protein